MENRAEQDGREEGPGMCMGGEGYGQEGGTKKGTPTSNNGNDGDDCSGIDSAPTYTTDDTTMTMI